MYCLCASLAVHRTSYVEGFDNRNCGRLFTTVLVNLIFRPPSIFVTCRSFSLLNMFTVRLSTGETIGNPICSPSFPWRAVKRSNVIEIKKILSFFTIILLYWRFQVAGLCRKGGVINAGVAQPTSNHKVPDDSSIADGPRPSVK